VRTAPMTIRIESTTRWDALALARKLDRYHWFLVEPDLEHWVVHVSLEDEPTDALPSELREPLLEWLDERRLEQATVHAQAADIVVTRE
jgi:hypothetical protein